jgi:hypothetical protein
MSCSRRAFLAGLVLGAGSLLGCSEQPKGMPNFQHGTGPPIQKNLPLKKGKKPLPVEPPSPKPPP